MNKILISQDDVKVFHSLLNTRQDHAKIEFSNDTNYMLRLSKNRDIKYIFIQVHNKKQAIKNFGMPNDYYSIKYGVLANRDGSIRFLTSDGYDAEGIANLYNPTAIISRIKLKVLRLLQLFRLQAKLYNFNITLTIDNRLKLFSILSQQDLMYSSFYFGVRGSERSVLVCYRDEKRVTKYIKIPMNDKAKELLQKEYSATKQLDDYSIRSIRYPQIEIADQILLISSLSDKIRRTINKPTVSHYRYLVEILLASKGEKRISEISAATHSFNIIEETSQFRDEPMKYLHSQLLKVKDDIDVDGKLITYYAHGDFTPWNMFFSKSILCVYDWEMANHNMPFMYDLIHFVAQSNILVYRKNSDLILKLIYMNINKLLAFSGISISPNQIDLYIKMYLIIVASKYLFIYNHQKEELVEQAYWLVDFWCNAIEYLVTKQN